jgi:hypothetical protein
MWMKIQGNTTRNKSFQKDVTNYLHFYLEDKEPL